MKRLSLYLSILIGFLVFYTGCKSDNDALATFKGGQITRGEFYKWLDDKRLGKENILKSKSKQKNKLEYMAREKLTVMEAQKENLEKKPLFQNMLDQVKRNYLASYLRKKVRGEGKFNEEIIKASIIKLQIKDYKMVNNKRKKLSSKEIKELEKKKMAEAKNIIDRLKKGEDFKELAKTHSDDYTKRKGGDIGYISRGMRSYDFTKAAFALNKGDYTKNPVKIHNNIYIIKVDEKLEVTENSIESSISDANQAKRLKRRLLANNSRNLESKLLTASDVSSSFDNVSSKSKKAVLFTIGNKKFTNADLEKEIEAIEKKRSYRGASSSSYLDERRRKSLAERVFREKLLNREAIKRGLDKDSDFLKEWENFKNLTLAGSYRDEFIVGDIKVTQEDIKKEYEKNKDRIYTKTVKKGGKTVKEPKDFNEVKERIEQRLISRERAIKKRNWEKDLLKKYDFKIEESKLDGQ